MRHRRKSRREAVKVQRKPLGFDAVQWTGTVTDEINAIGNDEIRVKTDHRRPPILRVPGLFNMVVNVGDWLVRENGKLFVCADDHFQNTYKVTRWALPSDRLPTNAG